MPPADYCCYFSCCISSPVIFITPLLIDSDYFYCYVIASFDADTFSLFARCLPIFALFSIDAVTPADI